MHAYAIDSDERKVVPFYMAAVSIFAAWGFYGILGLLKLSLPWWIEAPSALFFYGLIYGVFENWLWRWDLLRKINVVKVPDLRGRWQGHAASSFDQHSQRLDATIEIKQSWTKISITMETANSKSNSLIAGITTESPGGPTINHEYCNEPKSNAQTGMHAHRGTARLVFKKENNTEMFEGEYYSGRDRQNHGSLHFKRISKRQ